MVRDSLARKLPVARMRFLMPLYWSCVDIDSLCSCICKLHIIQSVLGHSICSS
jgi:hypothetical protein